MRDEWFDLLSNEVRRLVLYELLEQERAGDGSVSLAALPTYEYDERTIRILLHHTHLPKLDNSGVVSWDREQQRVDTGPAFDDLRPLLEAVEPLVERDLTP